MKLVWGEDGCIRQIEKVFDLRSWEALWECGKGVSDGFWDDCQRKALFPSITSNSPSVNPMLFSKPNPIIF